MWTKLLAWWNSIWSTAKPVSSYQIKNGVVVPGQPKPEIDTINGGVNTTGQKSATSMTQDSDGNVTLK